MAKRRTTRAEKRQGRSGQAPVQESKPEPVQEEKPKYALHPVDGTDWLRRVRAKGLWAWWGASLRDILDADCGDLSVEGLMGAWAQSSVHPDWTYRVCMIKHGGKDSYVGYVMFQRIHGAHVNVMAMWMNPEESRSQLLGHGASEILDKISEETGLPLVCGTHDEGVAQLLQNLGFEQTLTIYKRGT